MLKSFLGLQRGTVQATSGVENQSQGVVVIGERLSEPGEALEILQIKRPVGCFFRVPATERDRELRAAIGQLGRQHFTDATATHNQSTAQPPFLA